MSKMGFVKGIVTGVLVGGAAAMLFDPITPRQRRRIRHQASNMMRSVGQMVEDLMPGK